MISDKLIQKTFDYFNKFDNEDFLVKPSIPILYFGDLYSYSNSKLKIITVGKNPSDNEFRLNKKDDFNFVRFPKWNYDCQCLSLVLNDYFEELPLENWFSALEPILNGFSSSYYKKNNPNNIAIHTDICSTIATYPTWSNLKKEDQDSLFKEGYLIWKQLIEELEPDILLISIPKKLFLSIFNTFKEDILTFKEKKDGTKRKRPYVISIYEYELKNKKVKVIFGEAANKPFGTISNEQKLKIGEICQK